MRTEETRQECRVLLAETHRRSTFIAVFIVHAKTSLFYTLQLSIKLVEIYVYARKKHPSSGYPSAKHPKHSKFAIIDRHTRKTNELFLERRPGINSSSRNNFKSSGFFAKVFIPVHIYNSLLQCAMVR